MLPFFDLGAAYLLITSSTETIFCSIISFYFLKFVIVVQVQLSPLSPCHYPPPELSPLPTLDPNPLGFVHVSFIAVPENLSPFPPHYPLPPPLWLLSVCS